MTRNQFQNQFKREVVADDYLLGIIQLERVFLDTPVYRALEKLVIIKAEYSKPSCADIMNFYGRIAAMPTKYRTSISLRLTDDQARALEYRRRREHRRTASDTAWAIISVALEEEVKQVEKDRAKLTLPQRQDWEK
jgi:hypothetical protein